jgi:hypothetical protein
MLDRVKYMDKEELPATDSKLYDFRGEFNMISFTRDGWLNGVFSSIKSRDSCHPWNGTLKEPGKNFRKYTGT